MNLPSRKKLSTFLSILVLWTTFSASQFLTLANASNAFSFSINGTAAFNGMVFEVPSSSDSVTVSLVAPSGSTSIITGDTGLQPGANSLTVTTTFSDSTQSTQSATVIRDDPSDATLDFQNLTNVSGSNGPIANQGTDNRPGSSLIKGQQITYSGGGGYSSLSVITSASSSGSVILSYAQSINTSTATSMFPTNPNSQIKTIKYLRSSLGSITDAVIDGTAGYNNEALSSSDCLVVRVISEDRSTTHYYVFTFSISLSNNAELSLTSQVKGQTLNGVGTPLTQLLNNSGFFPAGSAYITLTQAADANGAPGFTTNFIPSDSYANIVHIVKYPSTTTDQSINETNFAAASSYANAAISNGDFFIIEVMAQDGTTKEFYKIKVSLPGSSYTFSGPTGGTANVVSSNFTITPQVGIYTGTISIAVSGGGLSTTITKTFTNSSAAQTFTITPTSSSSSVVLTPTATPALGTNPSPLTYAVTPASLSSISTLTGISLSTGTLSPSFSSGVTSYNVYLSSSVTGVGVTPTFTGPGESATYNGLTTTTSGVSSSFYLGSTRPTNLSIVTTAQDGTHTTYTINVLAPATSFTLTGPVSGLINSSSSNFSVTPVGGAYNGTITLSVSGGGISATTITKTFTNSSAAQTFTVTPTSAASSVLITPVSASPALGTLPAALSYLVVNPSAPLASTSSIISLTIPGISLSPTFSGVVQSYTTTVDNSVSSITLTPTFNGIGETVTVNGSLVTTSTASNSISLNEGSNAITVTGTAQDGSTTIYTFSITRSAAASSSPGSVVTTPDPQQTSTIAVPSNPSSGSTAGGSTYVVSGSFPTSIANISVADQYLPNTSWVQTSTSVAIIMPPHEEGTVLIQIYNGQVPLLAPIPYVYSKNVGASTPTPTPTPTPTNIGVFGFKTGSAAISKSAVKVLTRYAVGTKIIITGYAEPTDPKGDFKLSLKRAQSVKAQLLKLNPKLSVEVVAGGTSYNSACASARNKCVVIQKIG